MHQLFHDLLHQGKLSLPLALRLGHLALNRENLRFKLLRRALNRLLPLSEYFRDFQRFIVTLFELQFHLCEEECALLLNVPHFLPEKILQL